MADDQITAAQAVQDTPPAEGNESTEAESQVQTQSQEETQTEASSENQQTQTEESDNGKTGDQSGQEAKPTRFERRIQQLSQKLKEVGQSKSQSTPTQGAQSYFTQEELEEGAVDPNELIKRVQGTVQQEVQKAIKMDRMNQQFESSVLEHQRDMDSVKDIDPDLESEAVAEYEAINYQINPFTGEKVFVPAVKLSEIVHKIQSRAEKLAEKLAQQKVEANERHLSDVSSSQAVPSGGSVTSAKGSVAAETTNFADFEKAYSK